MAETDSHPTHYTTRDVGKFNLVKSRVTSFWIRSVYLQISNETQNSVDFVSNNTGIIEIGVNEVNNDAIFFVRDNGPGIPQEKQEKPTLLVEYNQPKPPKPKQPAVNPYSFTKN